MRVTSSQPICRPSATTHMIVTVSNPHLTLDRVSPMSLVRALLVISSTLSLVACGQQPANQSTTQASASAPLLTAEEMSKVLLGNAKIWKFESKPGVVVKLVRLDVVENGKTYSAMSSLSGVSPVLTKIIVVIQEVGQKHLMRIYQEHASGSSLGSGDVWFSKPLTVFEENVQTEVKPIQLGTTMLIGGWTEVTPGKSYATDGNEPCRINLIIE